MKQKQEAASLVCCRYYAKSVNAAAFFRSFFSLVGQVALQLTVMQPSSDDNFSLCFLTLSLVLSLPPPLSSQRLSLFFIAIVRLISSLQNTLFIKPFRLFTRTRPAQLA
ncbi:MAG: hypothetical protein J3R72DRAFT_184591 [Linnemannia gamsii]|nr:MAG: hypothetical protein J3R72DRAFT_184591 [Linnemannia gamsii]